MEQPESVFASGKRYQEDFTSLDLIGWIGELLVDLGYLNKGDVDSFFAESAVNVSFWGEDYQQDSGAIDINTLLETPVERIDILTHYLQNKSCNRQMIFSFSKDSMNKNGEAIKAYLEKRVSDGTELSWAERNGESQCTISARNLTAKELNVFMSELFGDSKSFVNVQPQNRAGVFSSASDWSELVDVRSFSYNGGKVALGYYVQWEDGMDIAIHKQNEDKLYDLKDSERYGGYQTVLETDTTSESLVTQISSIYIIEDIEVDIEFSKEDYLSRNIALVFQVEPDRDDLEMIRKRIAKKAEGIAEVVIGEGRADGRTSICITQNGSIEELNDGFYTIFQVQGQLSHSTSGDLLKFKHVGSFVDLMDFTGFIENDPVLTTLTYRLSLPGGESILEDSVSSTVNLKQGIQEISGNEYTGTVAGAYLSLTMDSEVWNMDGVMLFFLLLGCVIVAVVIIILAESLRKACVKLRKRINGFNEAFAADDQVLEDFPDDKFDEREKKRFLFWKKPSYVAYEEIKFEEAAEEDVEQEELEQKNPEEDAEQKELEKGNSEQEDPEQIVERVTESSLQLEEDTEEWEEK